MAHDHRCRLGNILHLVEIVAWALFYSLQSAFPEFTTSAYFSAMTKKAVDKPHIRMPVSASTPPTRTASMSLSAA